MARRGPTSAADERRRAILDAALSSFLERGSVSATIDDIRQRSGASVGSITHHYGKKEELVAALFYEGLRGFYEGFIPEIVKHRSARAGIQAGLRYHIEWFVEHPDIGRFLLHMRESELIELTNGKIRELNREKMREVVTWLRPFQEKGEVRTMPLSVLTSLWIGPAQEYCRQWLGGIARTPPERVIPLLADAVWQSLRGKRSGGSR
jgi:AcrR family transcriptional regulator